MRQLIFHQLFMDAYRAKDNEEINLRAGFEAQPGTSFETTMNPFIKKV